jgi:hypothetical protein
LSRHASSITAEAFADFFDISLLLLRRLPITDISFSSAFFGFLRFSIADASSLRLAAVGSHFFLGFSFSHIDE